MARAALFGCVSWYGASVVASRAETPRARTLSLAVPGWPGHVAGQHVDVRLTAPDGYTAVRSYSVANAPVRERVELTVEEVTDGEVSAYLVEAASVGDRLELRGPIGGWFVWQATQSEPVQLIAGGSGIVPLTAMIRARAAAGSRAPFRLLYSVRNQEAMFYGVELAQRAREDGVEITYAYTRAVPAGSPQLPKRVDAKTIADAVWPACAAPTCYVCGPTVRGNGGGSLSPRRPRGNAHQNRTLRTDRRHRVAVLPPR